MRGAILLATILWSGPAAALEICDDLWFTRNLAFHRAGYCFGSPLGQAVFGNDGCTTRAPALDPESTAVVERVRRREREWECQVDTTRRRLNVPAQALRRQMHDLPIATGFESSCGGWRGDPVTLRAARDDLAPATGAARPGDTLLFQFEDEVGWSFVEVLRGDSPAGAGWARIGIGEATCAWLAG